MSLVYLLSTEEAEPTPPPKKRPSDREEIASLKRLLNDAAMTIKALIWELDNKNQQIEELKKGHSDPE